MVCSPPPLLNFFPLYHISHEKASWYQIAYRAHITHMRTLDAKCFGLTVDALSRSTLAIDTFIHRMISIGSYTQQSSFFDIDVFDTAFSLSKLLMLAGLPGWCRKQKRTTV